MPFTSTDLVEVALNMTFLSQRCLNVWHYKFGSFSGTPSAAELGEAWWNAVKSVYRGALVGSASAKFISVTVKDLANPLGEYGEFSIPTGEQQGSRDGSTLGDWMPPYASVGTRFTVGTRATRPGQKRFPFLTEGDQANGVLTAGVVAVTETWAAFMDGEISLSSPVASTSLIPIVVKSSTIGTLDIDYQPIIGHVINPNATTQNTRKIGRGS